MNTEHRIVYSVQEAIHAHRNKAAECARIERTAAELDRNAVGVTFRHKLQAIFGGTISSELVINISSTRPELADATLPTNYAGRELVRLVFLDISDDHNLSPRYLAQLAGLYVAENVTEDDSDSPYPRVHYFGPINREEDFGAYLVGDMPAAFRRWPLETSVNPTPRSGNLLSYDFASRMEQIGRDIETEAGEDHRLYDLIRVCMVATHELKRIADALETNR